MIPPVLIHLHAHLSLNLNDHILIAANLVALTVCGHPKHQHGALVKKDYSEDKIFFNLVHRLKS